MNDEGQQARNARLLLFNNFKKIFLSNPLIVFIKTPTQHPIYDIIKSLSGDHSLFNYFPILSNCLVLLFSYYSQTVPKGRLAF